MTYSITKSSIIAHCPSKLLWQGAPHFFLGPIIQGKRNFLGFSIIKIEFDPYLMIFVS